MTLMIIIGFILLVIPGIYLSFAYMFSLPLMIEKDLTAWQALEVSRKAVTRIWFRATGFLLLVMMLADTGDDPAWYPADLDSALDCPRVRDGLLQIVWCRSTNPRGLRKVFCWIHATGSRFLAVSTLKPRLSDLSRDSLPLP